MDENNGFEQMSMLDDEVLEQPSPFAASEENNEQEEDLSPIGLDAIGEMAIGGTDWTAETIVNQMVKGNILLNPEFQRRDAWTTTKKSRFIESLFLGFPIPQIILAEQKGKKGKFLVIDGKQRLLSLQQFMCVDETEEKALKLTGLEVKQELNGKTYRKMIEEHLDSDIDALSNQPIRTVVVRNWPSVAILYLIFLRLNTGSVKLSPQELRQALYPGEFIRYSNIKASSSDAIMRILKKKNKNPDFRMRDVEILIRYMAFHYFAKEYHGSMQSFLDDTCSQLNAKWQTLEEDIKNQACEMSSAVDCVYKIFGGNNSFSKYKNNRFEGKTNRAIMDVMLFYFADKPTRDKALQKKERVLEGFKNLCCTDTRFMNAIEQTTKSLDSVTYRFNKWAEVLGSSIQENIISPYIG